MPTVACVLKSGGDYTPEHVVALYDGVRAYWPDALRFVCLSDVGGWTHPGITILPLHYGWPGWFSKLELFRPFDFCRPEIGDLLYFDLDTVITGDLHDIASVGRLTILRDFYRPDGLQSSVMYIPASERDAVWAAWMDDPRGHVHRFRDDQRFLETLWLGRASLWQDLLPGQLVSWKADEVADGLPEDARVVVYHGRPRPWETELWAA